MDVTPAQSRSFVVAMLSCFQYSQSEEEELEVCKEGRRLREGLVKIELMITQTKSDKSTTGKNNTFVLDSQREKRYDSKTPLCLTTMDYLVCWYVSANWLHCLINPESDSYLESLLFRVHLQCM